MLDRVYRAEGNYPPRTDVDGTETSLAHWLFDAESEARWTAALSAVPVGHVLVHAPGAYLTSRYTTLGLCPDRHWLEVGKLFCDPRHYGRGVGAALLRVARDYALANDAALLLCVLDSSGPATALYHHEGLTDVGEFHGAHGRNVVFTEST